MDPGICGKPKFTAMELRIKLNINTEDINLCLFHSYNLECFSQCQSSLSTLHPGILVCFNYSMQL